MGGARRVERAVRAGGALLRAEKSALAVGDAMLLRPTRGEAARAVVIRLARVALTSRQADVTCHSQALRGLGVGRHVRIFIYVGTPPRGRTLGVCRAAEERAKRIGVRRADSVALESRRRLAGRVSTLASTRGARDSPWARLCRHVRGGGRARTSREDYARQKKE
jgi:hypothetical protein